MAKQKGRRPPQVSAAPGTRKPAAEGPADSPWQGRFGRLPPPRPNRGLLIVASLLLVLWIVVLAILALTA